MKNSNGTIWKIAGLLTTVLVLVVSIAIAYGTLDHEVDDNCKSIAEMKPDVQKNNEHRIKDEVDTIYIKEKITNIEIVQKQILEEVRK
jgi:hypothetical protein